MRNLFFLVLMVASLGSMAQVPGSFYVAAKSGLSLREKQDLNSKVIVKIPYGTKIAVSYPDEAVTTSAEGMEGQWAKTTFNGKTGYIVNSYLLPWPPPKSTTQTMKQYLAQVSAVAGVPVVIKNGAADISEDYHNMKKQLFKNGAEYHEETFYEANNDTYFLPGFSLQQGFILLRLLPEFKNVFSDKAMFPTTDMTTKNGEIENTIKVDKPGDGDWINKITVTYEEGASYSFEMFLLGGQLVISFGGGV
jgi:hypothetical protein